MYPTAPIGPPPDSTVTPGTPAAALQQQEHDVTAEEQAKAADTKAKRDAWRRPRIPHEQQWFVNGGMMRGQHHIEFDIRTQQLVVNKPTVQERHALNRTRTKVSGKRAKIIKHRTKVLVTPATSDSQDRMNARATRMAVDYVWRKQKAEQKRRRAIMTAEVCSRGYWWLHWDESAMGTVLLPDPITGQPTRTPAVVGDVKIEVGSPYEVLVADPTIPVIGEQPEIIRIKLRRVEEMRKKYPEHAHRIVGSTGGEDLFRYEKQIASLNATGYGAAAYNDKTMGAKGSQQEWVLVTEHFIHPSPDRPEGEYRVLVGDSVLAKVEPKLPFGFADLDNPYPVVEFVDIPNPNQYWGTTLVEQLIPVQREYNSGRGKLAEHIKLNVHPKIIVFKQHRMPPNAWHAGAGEIIELQHMPGLPPPIVVQPPNVAGDLWRALDTMRGEFDDISQVYPVAEGQKGGTTSGFQTNLLQEATDSVFKPDMDAHVDSLEEAVFKIRRLIKMGYDVPRLISITGRNQQPDAQEFSNSQVDEAADIKVEIGSALPDLRAQRLQMLKEMYEGQLFGLPGSPEASRQFFSLAELGGPDDAIDKSRVDENAARIENNDFSNGQPLANPEFFDNHIIHMEVHTELYKSPEARSWPPEQKENFLLHLIGHLDYINPLAAFDAATRYGLPPPPMALQAQQQLVLKQQQEAMQADNARTKGQPPSSPQPSPQPAPAAPLPGPPVA